MLTGALILICETGVAAAEDWLAEILDLFAALAYCGLRGWLQYPGGVAKLTHFVRKSSCHGRIGAARIST